MNKVSSPKFVEITHDIPNEKLNFILKKIEKKQECFVVKPCDNMGGRGCRMIMSSSELMPAINDAIKNSRTKRAIVEEYMDGKEYSIDGLFFNGELTITGFADRHIFYPPYFIEMGHTMPTTATDVEKKELIKTFYEGIKALGLSYGAVKADIKLTSKGPMIGEIAARLSGGYMSGWTYPYASNINLTKQALLLALGETPHEILEKRVPIQGLPAVYEIPCKKVSAEKAWLSIPGIVKKIENLDTVKKIKGVCDVFPRIKTGDSVKFPINNVEKAGNIITCLVTRKESVETCNNARKTVFIRLVPNVIETKKFLQQSIDTQFPPSAYPYAKNMPIKEALRRTDPDWNGLTLKETLEILPRLVTIKIPIDNKKFLHSLYRGGLQGAVYFCETYGEK